MEKVINSVAEDRTFFEGLGDIYPADGTVAISKEAIDNIPVYWFEPPKHNTDNEDELVIYLHGGSYALGSIKSHKPMISHLANALDKPIVFIEYSLAPENPYPHAIHEVIAIYKDIIKQNTGSTIHIIGDSAGGGLAISSIASMTSSTLELPHSISLISPWVDLRCKNPSYEKRKDLDPILTREDLNTYAGYYAPNNRAEANPAQLKFDHFSPTFLLVGGHEILYSDTKNFYETIKPIQPNTQMQVYEDQTHVWPLTDIESTATQNAFKAIDRFQNKVLNGI